MGMQEEIYIGVYIELELDSEYVDETNRVCEEGHIFHNKNAKFCPMDGTEIKDKSKQVSRDITIGDLIDEGLIPFGYDDFCIINVHNIDKTWLVENNDMSHYGMFLDNINYGSMKLSKNKKHLLDKFNKEYENLIKRLEANCKSVKVEYGIIKYYE